MLKVFRAFFSKLVALLRVGQAGSSLVFSLVHLTLSLPFLVRSFSREIWICGQICSSFSGSWDVDAQSFQSFLFQTRGSAERGSGWKLSQALPCLSNVVTALANGTTGSATPTDSVRGLQQEPGLPARSLAGRPGFRQRGAPKLWALVSLLLDELEQIWDQIWNAGEEEKQRQCHSMKGEGWKRLFIKPTYRGVIHRK